MDILLSFAILFCFCLVVVVLLFNWEPNPAPAKIDNGGYDLEINIPNGLLPTEHKPDDFRVTVDFILSQNSPLYEGIKSWMQNEIKAENTLKPSPSIYKGKLNVSGAVISIIGPYNVGKTFVHKHLCGKSFAPYEGTDKHTPSLCYSWTFSEQKHRVYIDSAGAFMPLMVLVPPGERRTRDEVFRSATQIQTTVDAGLTEGTIIHDRKQSDLFQRDLILDQADLVILVVGDMQWPHQEMIAILRRDYQIIQDKRDQEGLTSKSAPFIIVVHNWKDVETETQMEIKMTEQIVNSYDFRAGTIERDQQFGLTYFVSSHKAPGAQNLPILKHVVLCNDSDMSEHNKKAFSLVRSWIDAELTSNKQLNPLEYLKQACTEDGVLSRYVANISKLQMKYVATSGEQATEENNSTILASLISAPIPVPKNAKRPDHLFVNDPLYHNGAFVSSAYAPLSVNELFVRDNVLIEIYDTPAVELTTMVNRFSRRDSPLNSHLLIDYRPDSSELHIHARRTDNPSTYREKFGKLPRGDNSHPRHTLVRRYPKMTLKFHSAYLYRGQLFIVYLKSDGRNSMPTNLPIDNFKQLYEKMGISVNPVNENLVEKLPMDQKDDHLEDEVETETLIMPQVQVDPPAYENAD